MAELIKQGSEGSAVISWQGFLQSIGLYKGKIDGDFGEKTKKATMSFQKKHGLTDDGVVGKATYSVAYTLGFLCTEILLNVPERKIYTEAHLPKSEYLPSNGKKEWVFLHHTAGWENPFNTITAWGRDSRGAVATEFVIGGQKITNGDIQFDGKIVQAFPTGCSGWHLGTGSRNMHLNSVAIEVCNFGYLKDGKTYVGTKAHDGQIVKLAKPFRGHTYWHGYSTSQLNSLRELLLYIANRDNIDIRKGLPELIKTKGADAFDVCDVKMCEKTKGLWNHTNVRKDKVDMFPQQELIDMLLSL